MLQSLHIQNYAIIQEINIRFSKQLNIITGETGAGKSILVGALGLVLGERAETGTLMNREKKALVEATFEVNNRVGIHNFLAEQELDVEPTLVVRREIAPNGKSRAFINDTPVSLQQLKTLSSLLVDLHQQFDTVELGDELFQQEVLDALAGNAELLSGFQTHFQQYQTAKKVLEQLKQQQLEANTALDYNQFLFDELDAANFAEDEIESLEQEQKLLSNAEQIRQQLGALYFELNESDQPLVQQLKMMANKLSALQAFHPGVTTLVERMQAAQIELQDIADEIDSLNNSIHVSAENVQKVNDRISLGYQLFRKHHVNSTRELKAIQENLSQKLSNLLQIGDQIAATEQQLATAQKSATDLAATISNNRKKALVPFTKEVNRLLAQVGMPNAAIQVQLTTTSLQATGTDEIEFLFDANKSNRFEPLRKVASGGELSRLMLCIKSLVAEKLDLPTLIFDEIDTGISGEAAKQVGNIMKTLSRNHQLISITHQPQIAAKADAHYFVFKSSQNKVVATSIRELDKEERITAIAQMLSGEKPTAAALENAREMVS